jgi:hypothetical protein
MIPTDTTQKVEQSTHIFIFRHPPGFVGVAEVAGCVDAIKVVSQFMICTGKRIRKAKVTVGRGGDAMLHYILPLIGTRSSDSVI